MILEKSFEKTNERLSLPAISLRTKCIKNDVFIHFHYYRTSPPPLPLQLQFLVFQEAVVVESDGGILAAFE